MALKAATLIQKTVLKQCIGYTILELLIVLVIVGVLSIGIYLIWSTTTISLRNTADIIKTDIEYARNLSMTTNTRYRVDLTSSTQYRILNSSGTAVVIPSTWDSTTATLPTGYTLTTSNYLVFDGKGTPYSSTTATGSGTKITSDLTLTLTAESESVQIVITAETGRIYTP